MSRARRVRGRFHWRQSRQRRRRRSHSSSSFKLARTSDIRKYATQPRITGVSSSITRSSRRPRPRLKTSFSFSFSRFTDSGATFSRGVRCTVTLYPRNFRLQGRATALLSRLTFSRRRSHRNFSSDSITRSPARRDCTYTLQSSAYRQKRCPRRSSSLSSSSSRTLLSNGDSGPPCGVPSRRGDTTLHHSRL